MAEFPLLDVLKALSNETRLAMLEWLANPLVHFDKEAVKEIGICVSHIQRKAGMSQSTVSSYLSTLQKAGLVEARREGQWTYYKLNRKRLEELRTTLAGKFIGV